MANFAGGLNPPLPGYHLTFADDFDAPSWYDGTNAASGAWYPYLNFGNQTLSGNNEQEAYVWPAFQGTSGSALNLNPFSFSNSILTITADKVPSNLLQYMTNIHGASSSTQQFQYYSGAISTWHIWKQQFGYFEMRCKIPVGQASWPAWWLMGSNDGWPPEIDIFEFVDSNRQPVMTYHWTGGGMTNPPNTAFVADCDTAWHTYGLEWKSDNTMTWYIDGVQWWTLATDWPAADGVYLIANLAVGGYWPGYVDSTTPFPLQYQIDWVRCWSNDSGVGTWTGPGTVASNYYGAGNPASSTPDTVVISVSEDKGTADAQFTVTLDGATIGSTSTVTTLHSSGNWQSVNIGPFISSGSHSLVVTYSNTSSGSALYLQGITIDGTAITPNVTKLTSTTTSSTVTFDKSSSGSITNTTSSTPPDTIVVSAAEQAYGGDAQFQLSMDGTNIGATTTVTSSYNSSSYTDSSFTVPISAGSHTISATFLNDSWGGSPDTDRNLIIGSITVDSVKMLPVSRFLGQTGNAATISFTKNSDGTITDNTAATSDLISVWLSQDVSGTTNAQVQIYIDGTAVGTTPTTIVTAHAGTPVWTVLGMTPTLTTGAHTINVTHANPTSGAVLYIQQIMVDGVKIVPPATVLNNTTQSTTIKINKSGPNAVTDTTAGAASDTIVISASEDASSGDASFQLLIDGVAVGSTQSVTAAHSAASYQSISMSANLSSGADHTVTARFTNPATGRNLYIQSITVDSVTMVPTFTALTGSNTDATVKFNKSSGGTITNKTPAGAGAPTAILQGSIGLPGSGSDLVVGNTAISSGLPVYVSNWTITAPGA